MTDAQNPSRKRYSSPDVDVTFDASICRHAGECVRGLPEVFNVKARPWIQPGAAPADRVAEVVARCPSGALRVEPPTG